MSASEPFDGTRATGGATFEDTNQLALITASRLCPGSELRST